MLSKHCQSLLERERESESERGEKGDEASTAIIGPGQFAPSAFANPRVSFIVIVISLMLLGVEKRRMDEPPDSSSSLPPVLGPPYRAGILMDYARYGGAWSGNSGQET